ncbi:MAG: hypothetical protein PHD37_00945 [Gallionellaceae bacterium]|nr:hypothetical protein [Gallionellaceae bacterium]
MINPAQPTNAAKFLAKRDSLAPYLERVAPRTLQSLVRAGDLDGAKRYSDFIDSPEGRNHTSAWATAMDRTAAGDFDGAIPVLAGLYGPHAKATRLGDGQWRLDFHDADGQVTTSRSLPAQELATNAVAELAPHRITKENTTMTRTDTNAGFLANRRTNVQQPPTPAPAPGITPVVPGQAQALDPAAPIANPATAGQAEFLRQQGVTQDKVVNHGAGVSQSAAQVIERQGKYGGGNGLSYQLSGLGDQNSMYASASKPGGKLDTFTGAGTGKASSPGSFSGNVVPAAAISTPDFSVTDALRQSLNAAADRGDWKAIQQHYANKGETFNGKAPPLPYSAGVMKALSSIESDRAVTANNAATIAETKRHNLATEQVRGTKDASPAQVLTAEWLVSNGVAKDAAAAWELVGTSKEKSRESAIQDLAGKLMANLSYQRDPAKATTDATTMVDAIRAKPAQSAKATNTPRARFDADPAMSGYRFGEPTGAQGWKVYDASGAHVGFYR